jgi:glutamyl-tRNA synthetase
MQRIFSSHHQIRKINTTCIQHVSSLRYYSTKRRTEVVTRFAPSPTGFMHLGALRTALYNYLIAKQKNGKFILRIEDTDQKRLVEGSVEQIQRTLDWVGIKYDQFEVQSQRTAIYNKYAYELLEKGHAYKCYCSEERLQWLRDKGLKYDRHCNSLSKEEIEEHERSGKSYTIRMKIPTSSTERLYTTVDDLIFGSMKFENALLDDQILLKSDGHPTYHLANVVDDFEMKVSHVIRGVEWLSSTPKHVILYDMLFPDLERPVFAHLPLLVDETGAKLSKRKDHASVDWYRNQGYLASALVNFVALLGWNPGKGSEKEIWTLQELIQGFSLENVNKGNSAVSLMKLNWLNGQFTKKLVSDHPEIAQKMALDSLRAFLPQSEANIAVDPDFLCRVLELIAERLGNPHRFGELCWYFFSDFKFQNNTASTIINSKDSMSDVFTVELQKVVCDQLIQHFSALKDFNVDQINNVLNQVKVSMKAQSVNYKDIVTFIRLTCTGEKVGAPIGQTLHLIGQDRLIQRLTQARNLLG